MTRQQNKWRIHVVGAQESNFPWGFENKIIGSLRQLGHEVLSTDFRTNRARLPQLLLRDVDLTLICKGEGIPPELIRNIPSLTALWYAEQIGGVDQVDPLAAARRKELAYNLSAFDFVFSHDEGNLELYTRLGAKRVAWLSTAVYDPAVQKVLEVEKTHDVAFVGTLTPRRQEILRRLGQNFNVHVAQIWDPVALNECFNRSKIVLNLHLSSLPNTESRVAEALGAGAFLLSETLSSPGLVAEGVHYCGVPIGDVDALAEKTDYFLKHDEEREAVARAGRLHIEQNHSIAARMHQLLGHIDFSLRLSILPSMALGILRNQRGEQTLRIDDFYAAVRETIAVQAQSRRGTSRCEK